MAHKQKPRALNQDDRDLLFDDSDFKNFKKETKVVKEVDNKTNKNQK
jgi:hypothetical protein